MKIARWYNRGADRRREPCKQAQLDCADSAVRSSALFWRKAPGQGTGRSQRRDSRRRSRREHIIHREARILGDPVECLVGRIVLWAISMSERRALFTASSLGNASATSGLRTMTFDDSFKRFTYLPRTRPPGKSERLYSGRSSPLSVSLSFFIEFSFSFARLASAYDSNVFAFFSVRHHHQPTSF